MKNAKLVLSLIIAIMTTSCVTVDYVGNSYQRTEQVDIYFDEINIQQEYEIIGQAIGEGPNIEKIQDNLVKKAKEEGADGLIIRFLARDVDFNGEARRQITASFLRYR